MRKKIDQVEVIRRFIEIHGNIYDYKNVIYKNREEKISIICDVHGEFKQRPHNHIEGSGCPKCAIEKTISTNISRYSVRHPMQNSVISSRHLSSSYKTKWYITPKHNIWFCQGYEPILFNELLTIYREEDIITDYNKMPEFWYRDNDNVLHRYYPDCYIPQNR